MTAEYLDELPLRVQRKALSLFVEALPKAVKVLPDEGVAEAVRTMSTFFAQTEEQREAFIKVATAQALDEAPVKGGTKCRK